jgi:hypothetical protein
LKNAWRLILALAAAALAVWLWQVLFPSPEKVIAGQFEKLARDASVQPGEGSLPRLLDAQKAGSFFSASVDININLPGHQRHEVMSRDDIVQALTAVHMSGGMTVKFPDINVTVGEDRETAQADVTVVAQTADEPNLMVQEMKFTLQKIDGKWLITRVQTVRTLS